MLKMWAKSKSIHTAKDGALSSYGYSILAASFLAARGATKALLPSERGGGQSVYVSNDSALEYVLAKAGGEDPEGLWEAPAPGGESCQDADKTPTELFVEFLGWMEGTVLGFVERTKGLPGGVGTAPLFQRYIVSVRPRTQSQLLQDLQKWTPKRDHWMPSSVNEIFLTIEEPLNGENVARSVRAAGFWAIMKEVHRARASMDRKHGTVTSARFKALLEMPALARSMPPLPSLGRLGVAPPGVQQGAARGAMPTYMQRGLKRPLGRPGVLPAAKRPVLGFPGRPAAGPVVLRPVYGGGKGGGKGGLPSGVVAAAYARARTQQQQQQQQQQQFSRVPAGVRPRGGAFQPGVMHTQRGTVFVQPGFAGRPTARPRGR